MELREQASLSDDAILGALRGQVAPWWLPDEVIRLPSMPLGLTGKIDKVRLRAQYGGA